MRYPARNEHQVEPARRADNLIGDVHLAGSCEPRLGNLGHDKHCRRGYVKAGAYGEHAVTMNVITPLATALPNVHFPARPRQAHTARAKVARAATAGGHAGAGPRSASAFPIESVILSNGQRRDNARRSA